MRQNYKISKYYTIQGVKIYRFAKYLLTLHYHISYSVTILNHKILFALALSGAILTPAATITSVKNNQKPVGQDEVIDSLKTVRQPKSHVATTVRLS